VPDLETFREEVREWIEENCPPSKRGPDADREEVWGGRNAVYKNPDSKLWLDGSDLAEGVRRGRALR
jgi:hypothetical protein